MSTKVGTFDPLEVALVPAGHTITGYAPDEFITVEHDSDLWGDVVGAQGEVARYRLSDGRGTITVKLLQTADDNVFFSQLMNGDITTGKATFPVIMADNSAEDDNEAGSVAWIKRKPGKSYSNSGIATIEWQIRVAHMESLFGSHVDITP